MSNIVSYYAFFPKFLKVYIYLENKQIYKTVYLLFINTFCSKDEPTPSFMRRLKTTMTTPGVALDVNCGAETHKDPSPKYKCQVLSQSTGKETINDIALSAPCEGRWVASNKPVQLYSFLFLTHQTMAPAAQDHAKQARTTIAIYTNGSTKSVNRQHLPSLLFAMRNYGSYRKSLSSARMGLHRGGVLTVTVKTELHGSITFCH